MKKTKIGIIGASGYSGRELIKILLGHSQIEISFVSSLEDKGKNLSQCFPYVPKKYASLTMSEVNIFEIKEKCDLVFFATPSGVAKDLAPKLYKEGLKIVDISGDFRLSTKEDYKKWYNYDHPYPELLNEVTYCIPEINRSEAVNADFISNPGCYPTSILLPLIPVLQEIIYNGNIIIDSKSGSSGAGRKLNYGYLFYELNENFYAYKVGGTHQHIPEIEKYMHDFTGKKNKICFTPYLLPIDRGILSTLYLTDVSPELAIKGIKALQNKFANEYFIKYLDNDFPKIKDVCYTNQCHIRGVYEERTSTLILISAIDNLVKGAAGQAVQNMNLMLGFDEKEGLC